MERFSSLINSLKTNYEAGKSNAELLNLLEEMRLELTRSHPAADQTVSRVSVWLPAGYQSFQEVRAAGEVAVAEFADHIIEYPVTEPLISEELIGSLQTAGRTGGEINGSSFLLMENRVPKPPQVTHVEEEENGQPPIVAENENCDDDFVLPGNFHIKAPAVFGADSTLQNALSERHEEEAPVIIELKLDNEYAIEMPAIANTNVQSIPEGFLNNKTTQETGIAERPRELHEILANRVVAKPMTAEGKKQSAVLADKLSGGKINDLRKAIAINDRFRFIQSLFRGDDSLFERSVKTINNFSVLQEAQYWIQRELVIKLGWNEEDELVQLFYQLVSRRFS